MGWKEYSNTLEEWYGFSEARAQDDIIIDIYNKQRIEPYQMSHSDPWCHATVSAAAYQSGNQGRVPNTAYCPNGINWFKNRNIWVGRWANNYNPAVNNIIYYDWGGDGVSDHVGTVVGIENTNTLVVREGNKNDMLCDRRISRWSNSIMGYGTPNWGGSTIAKPTGSVHRVYRADVVKAGQIHSINFVGVKILTDGIPGVETKRQKIRVLQQALNLDYGAKLVVDGILGPKTLAALGQHYVCRGETQYMVTAWEILLMLNGFHPQGVQSPGEFGKGLEETTYQYQIANNLVPDKVAGRKSFLTALN